MKKVYKPKSTVTASSGIGSADYLIRMGYPGDRENATALKDYINEVVDNMDWSVKQIKDALNTTAIDDMNINLSVTNLDDFEDGPGCCVAFITNLSDVSNQIVKQLDAYFNNMIDELADSFDDNQTTTDVYNGEEDVSEIYFRKK